MKLFAALILAGFCYLCFDAANIFIKRLTWRERTFVCTDIEEVELDVADAALFSFSYKLKGGEGDTTIIRYATGKDYDEVGAEHDFLLNRNGAKYIEKEGLLFRYMKDWAIIGLLLFIFFILT